MKKRIDSALLEAENAKRESDLNSDYAALGEKLARADIDIETITAKAGEFQIAVPSWGTGTGGTRFARFPGEGEPRNIFEKLEDCAVINELSGCTDSVSPHFPWDKVDDFSELKQQADEYGLKWVSVNSNTFQDQPGQEHSYKYGSLSNTQKASRDLAIQHNMDVIEYGQKLGAKSLTVWVGDGSNHPGQQHFQRAFERYLASMEEIYKGLPDDWEMHIEHKTVINELSGCTDSVSPHFPWDKVDDFSELKQQADEYGLKWVSVNSNTFQDQPGQEHSYKYGSLSNTQKASRDLAIQHNMDVIEYGQKLGAKSLTVWVGDGSNHPGQQHFQRAFERYLASMEEIYKGLPDDWEMHIEHKMFEPAFYSTIIQDWGSNLLAAMHLGPKCKSLVDLGHHAPNTNIEMIVSRLIQFKKLGGFHFNDSKYGDDDLDSGSLHPYQQFLIFNELVDAEYRNQEGFGPAYMLDQSHNVTDPAESLINSAIEVQRSYVKALLVNREALYGFQEGNDALMASLELKNAFNLDVSPILAMARLRKGSAIDPLAVYRQAGYRKAMAEARPRDPNATGSGIV